MTTSEPPRQRAERLRLYGLLSHWNEAQDAGWAATLLDWEETERARRSLERRLKDARIGRFKPLADFDWSWPNRCDRAAIDALMALDFLNDAGNAVVVGPNGVGKSTIARNIAHQAVLKGHTALFTSAGQLLGDLAAIAVFSLLETVGIAVDGDDVGVVDEAVDERDDAGGAGEHLVPVGERAVGGDQGALGLVASADQLEQHVGVAVGVGEISDLVDDQEGWGGVMAEAAAQGRGAVDRRQISEQLAGAGEQGGMAL